MSGLSIVGLELVRVLVLTSVDGAPARAEDVRATIDQEVELFAAVELAGSERAECVLLTAAERVASPCALAPFPEGWSFAWSKVEAGSGAYNNVPDGRFSTAPIDWVESPWLTGQAVVPADVRPIARAGIAHGSRGRASLAGTMRYRVHVTLEDGRTISSLAAPATVPGGPPRSADVRRVARRLDDSYLGMMTELGGLPYIFGSTELGREPHQAERGIGVDCADLMIYGLRRQGRAIEYRSSRTLGPVSRPIIPGPVGRRGRAYVDREGRPVRIGPRAAQPGDWIIFSGHVGALFEDRGAPGILDDEDLMIHIAWRELAVEPLAVSGYADVPFELRRPRP